MAPSRASAQAPSRGGAAKARRRGSRCAERQGAPPAEQAAGLATSPLALSDLEHVRQLGRGTFGTVSLVRRKGTKRLLAMKSLSLPPLSSREERDIVERRQAVREVDILKSLDSPFVVRYEEAIFAPARDGQPTSELHILTEYCDAGDLASHLKKRKDSGGLPEAEIWSFAASILHGLHELHSRHILHRDLKPANIFLKGKPALASAAPAGNRRGVRGAMSAATRMRRQGSGKTSPLQVKVGDLGLARTVSSSELASTMVGTPHYIAPEVYEGKPYGEKADVYSFGVCVYELMHNEPPWAECKNVAAIVRHVLRLEGDDSSVQHEPMFDARFSSELRGMVAACMAQEPEQRPSVAELLPMVPAAHQPAPLPELGQKEEVPAEEAILTQDGAAEVAAPSTAGGMFAFEPPSRGPSCRSDLGVAPAAAGEPSTAKEADAAERTMNPGRADDADQELGGQLRAAEQTMRPPGGDGSDDMEQEAEEEAEKEEEGKLRAAEMTLRPRRDSEADLVVQGTESPTAEEQPSTVAAAALEITMQPRPATAAPKAAGPKRVERVPEVSKRHEGGHPGGSAEARRSSAPKANLKAYVARAQECITRWRKQQRQARSSSKESTQAASGSSAPGPQCSRAPLLSAGSGTGGASSADAMEGLQIVGVAIGCPRTARQAKRG